jgi:hypothetical protein
MKKNKMKTEEEMRKSILSIAKQLNCEGDVKKIFEKYDNYLRTATDPQERYLIGLSGVKELHLFLECRGALIVNNEVILPPQKNFSIWNT